MRTLIIVLSLILMAGFVLVPVTPSDARGWYYGFSYYAAPVYGYYAPGYYYYPPVYRYYGYYPPIYGYYGYYPPIYGRYGYYGPRHHRYYEHRGHGRGWYRGHWR